MKYLNAKKSLLALGFLGVITACSSEHAVVGNIKVSNVSTSDCKTAASKGETTPEGDTDIYGRNTTLRMLMGEDNVIDAQFTDVMDNCGIKQLHVDATYIDNKLVLILYPDRDMLTDCVCMYDVNFKLTNLLHGSYQLEVYHTTSNKQTTPSNRIYQGSVVLEKHKAITLTLPR